MGRVNSASIYVRLIDMDQRVFSLGRLWRELWAGQPRAAFAGNFSQREKMQEIRKRLARFPGSAHRRPQPDVAATRCAGGHRLRHHRPRPGKVGRVLRGVATAVRARGSAGGIGRRPRRSSTTAATPLERIPGLVDTDTTLRLNKPELLVEIDRERAASLGVDVEEIAQTLRVAIGGDDRVSRYRDPLLDDVYDVELRLVGIDRESQEDIAQLYVRARAPQERPHATSSQDAASCAVHRCRTDAAGQRRPLPIGDKRGAHRPAGSSTYGRVSREHRPRLCVGRSHRCCARGRRGTGYARQLHHTRAGTRSRTGTYPARLRLDFCAVVHLHVHRAGRPVRTPRASADDSVLAAAGRALRTVQPLARRRVPQPLLGARYSRAVRHDQESVDSAGRPHQPAAREGPASGSTRSCRPIAIGCDRS